MEWTQDEKRLLKEALGQGLNPPKIKDQYLPHRTVDSIRGQANRIRLMDEDIPEANDAQFQLLKRQNDSLLRAIKEERAKTNLIIEALQESVAKLQVTPVKPPKIEKSNRELEFHALRSDEQVGAKVDPSRTQGVAFYDTDTYRKRSRRWCEKTLMFREEDKAAHGLNKLVIANLGDHVEGEVIYPGQAFHIDRPTVDQMMAFVEVEQSNYLALAKYFPQIEVLSVVGNHGRVGKKGEYHEKTNWDYVCMHFLRVALANQPNIRFFISNDPVMLMKHGNFNFCYKHGDNVKSYSGTPFYGLDRDFHRLNSLYNMIIHHELIGHHHRPVNIEDHVIINGCFPGGSDLSVNKMTLASRATQKIFYFHPEFGINRCTDIHLSELPELKCDANGLYTSYFQEE